MQQTTTTIFWSLEFRWLKETIEGRISQLIHLGKSDEQFELGEGPQTSLFPCPYTRLLDENGFTKAERLALALALAPTLQPSVLNPFLNNRKSNDQPVVEFGGVQYANSHAFIPTGETALFVLGGTTAESRLPHLDFFDPAHTFSKKDLVGLGEIQPGQPATAGVLKPSAELLAFARGNNVFQPKFSMDFPARRLDFDFEWEDLVLGTNALSQINHLKSWMKHQESILEGMDLKQILAPGYRVLFYGPPGTGKTLTAGLLGKELGKEVYRVDLSMVISKYIGETEKNLEKVFHAAEHRNWLLFFDEADALFGKRTKVKNSNDRFANQEVSYLLQRIEAFDGTVILASNDKKNIDDAFARRFQMIVHFPAPTKDERYRIWNNLLPAGCGLHNSDDLRFIADQYELSGGAIVNVIRFAAVKAAERGGSKMTFRDLVAGIGLEYHKVGKFLPAENHHFKQPSHVPT